MRTNFKEKTFEVMAKQYLTSNFAEIHTFLSTETVREGYYNVPLCSVLDGQPIRIEIRRYKNPVGSYRKEYYDGHQFITIHHGCWIVYKENRFFEVLDASEFEERYTPIFIETNQPAYVLEDVSKSRLDIVLNKKLKTTYKISETSLSLLQQLQDEACDECPEGSECEPIIRIGGREFKLTRLIFGEELKCVPEDNSINLFEKQRENLGNDTPFLT